MLLVELGSFIRGYKIDILGVPDPLKTDRQKQAAVKLYELGHLSSGIAAELAGMSRDEFLLNLSRYRVFPFASELAELEGSYAGLST